MNDLSVLNQQPTMTSLELVDYVNEHRETVATDAGFAFPSKEHPKLDHSDFLKKVIAVLGEHAGNFSAVYRGGNGQERPCYKFQKREACLMAMSYSYELQAKVFDRMTELEKILALSTQSALPDFSNPVIAARAWADVKESEQMALLRLEDARHDVEFVQRFVEAKSSKGLREVAKILNLPEKAFIAKLCEDGIIFRLAGNYVPMADYQRRGLFDVKTGVSNGHAYKQMRFTPDGIVWVAKRYAVLCA